MVWFPLEIDEQQRFESRDTEPCPKCGYPVFECELECIRCGYGF